MWLSDELPFILEKIKVGKYGKCICNFNTKDSYAVHFKNLKQALIYRVKLKKIHRDNNLPYFLTSIKTLHLPKFKN